MGTEQALHCYMLFDRESITFSCDSPDLRQNKKKLGTTDTTAQNS